MVENEFGRREAIKKAAIAGGVVGVVWSAPKIEGLSLRPQYAAAFSAGHSQGYNVNFASAGAVVPLGLDLGDATRFITSASKQNLKVETDKFSLQIEGGGLSTCAINLPANFTVNESLPGSSAKISLKGDIDPAVTFPLNSIAGTFNCS